MTKLTTVHEDTAAIESAGPAGITSRRLFFAVPVVGFAVLTGLFALGLRRDPNKLPSTLIGQAVPKFSLPPVKGRTLGLSSHNLVGEVSLVNFFASWCVPCRVEHPLFLDLHKKGAVPVHGINYKDRPEDAARWLNQRGDPYTRTGADLDGRVGIDWGVYGLPETFVIDAGGRIAYKHIGVLTEQALSRTILPLVDKLRLQAGGAKP